MIRNLLIAGVILASVTHARAAPLLGDFECLSGPDLYHGTMRVEDERFGFLTEAATVDAWYPIDLGNPAAVILDDAFAEYISAGGSVVSAQVIEDETSYSVVIRNKKGDDVIVTCIYVY